MNFAKLFPALVGGLGVMVGQLAPELVASHPQVSSLLAGLGMILANFVQSPLKAKK
jgi:hypothetical protein